MYTGRFVLGEADVFKERLRDHWFDIRQEVIGNAFAIAIGIGFYNGSGI